MKNVKSNKSRRNFIKNISAGTLAVGAAPLSDLHGVKNSEAFEKDDKTPVSNSTYTDERLNRIAFPIGGIGAGMICMEGTGALSHVSVRNKPEIFNEPAWFAGIHIKGLKNGAKVIEGPVPDWKKFGLKDAGNGLAGSTTGLPRFQKASFINRFPFCQIDLSDADIPMRVKILGWSPFIPTDDHNSSLPLGAIEYEFKNTGTKTLEGTFSFNSSNFLKVDKGKNSILSMEKGFILHEEGTDDKRLPGSFAIFTDADNAIVDHCWFRGGWWDPLTMAWNAVKEGNILEVPPVPDSAPGASLYIPFSIGVGKSHTIKLMMAWYTPESDLSAGKVGPEKTDCDPANGCCPSPDFIGLDIYDGNFKEKYYKPYYSNKYKSIDEIVSYWKSNYSDLKQKTSLFKDAFYASTLPTVVIEAVACNLSILKSPTMMRQYDGRLWNWEGCGDSGGCCHGSCTHVWNYAQAVAHLFPALERSLRHTEFCENQDRIGHQTFRATLPIMPTMHDFHAAADGQLGGIMKAYREWRISGDHEWLSKMYPMVKTSMDYCIETWDPKHKGVIEEPHHNTYDIEFWGADGMHCSFYLGALSAMMVMGKYLKKDTVHYEDLYTKGKGIIETELFDGEYFIQNIEYKTLNAPNPVEASAKSYGGQYSDEAKKLLEHEGPKYQYGKGCLSDGVLGAWIASMCGLPDPFDRKKITSHLKAVYKYNLKHNLSDHANPQRPAFALGNEGGLLLCSWPKGGKLSLPFVYSDEVWTGIEHQVASHLMMMGGVTEGLDIVKTSRSRYSGKIRNPFNEYECGHWYARALSSYGYLQALTGVRYDAVDKSLSVESKIGDFTSFISTATGFGTVSLKAGKVTYKMFYGDLKVDKINIV